VHDVLIAAACIVVRRRARQDRLDGAARGSVCWCVMLCVTLLCIVAISTSITDVTSRTGHLGVCELLLESGARTGGVHA
jgi:hypothetical protein